MPVPKHLKGARFLYREGESHVGEIVDLAESATISGVLIKLQWGCGTHTWFGFEQVKQTILAPTWPHVHNPLNAVPTLLSRRGPITQHYNAPPTPTSFKFESTERFWW